MSKKTTDQLIEELALSVGRSFSELEKHIHERFDAVNERLDRIEFHATGQGGRIEILEDRVRVIGRKIGLDAAGGTR